MLVFLCHSLIFKSFLNSSWLFLNIFRGCVEFLSISIAPQTLRQISAFFPSPQNLLDICSRWQGYGRMERDSGEISVSEGSARRSVPLWDHLISPDIFCVFALDKWHSDFLIV